MVRDGQAEVDLMVGTNADEWNLFAVMAKPPADDAAAARRLDRAGVDGAELVEGYRRGRPDVTSSALWSAIMTDLVFRIPAIRLLEAHGPNRPDHTFGYWFSLGGVDLRRATRLVPRPRDPVRVRHDGPARRRHPARARRAAVPCSQAMQDAWIAFARTGDPSHGGADGRWPAYDAGRRSTMEFGDRVGVLDDPGAEERLLWEGRL